MTVTNIYDTVTCHPSPKEPPLAHRFPFSAELLGPIHNICLRNKGLKPAGNETSIDSSWRLVNLCGTDRAAEFAARDLREFLDIALHERVPFGTETGNTGNVIRLKIDPRIGETESHRIIVDSNQVMITGADGKGVMRGVFHLERQMTARESPFLRRERMTRTPAMPIRLYRSPVACYGYEAKGHYDGEQYHGNILSRIAHHGFSGIWLKTWLRDLVEPVGGVRWPVAGQSRRRMELARLIDRAAEYGLSVFFHMQEPAGAGVNDPFWKLNPQLKGELFDPSHEYAFCSSTAESRAYLEQGFERLFTLLPGLGGVTLITASEHQSHCYSHVLNPAIEITYEHWPIYEAQCPRCRQRTGMDIAAEILNLIEKGVHRVRPDAPVIAWNWSWAQWEEDPQPSILRNLSPNITVMADCERGGTFEIFGQRFVNDEYSLTYPGPSPRFLKTALFERRHGKPIMAKVQISTTHEAGSLPHLPVMHSLMTKMEGLRKAGCRGGMFTWNFGCFTSILTDLASEYYFTPAPSGTALLNQVARRQYGPRAAALIVKAWKCFSDAGRFYPRDAWSLSLQPLNHGPAYPFFFEPRKDQSPSSWLDTAMLNHRLADWIHPPWTVHKRVRAFRKLVSLWDKGLAMMRRAESRVSPCKRQIFQRDLAVARAFRNMVLSDINVTLFAELRDRYHAKQTGRMPCLFRMRRICRDHLQLNLEMADLIRIDPRIGYHGEGHFMIISQDKLDRTRRSVERLSIRLDSLIALHSRTAGSKRSRR